jgi:5-methylcytosine-specific restriction endonuclease McrA
MIDGKRRLDYDAYLRTPHWRAVRRMAFRHHGRACAHCGDTHGLQVHHRHYDTLGREGPGDLEVVCTFCHEIADFARRHTDGDFDAAAEYLESVGNWI